MTIREWDLGEKPESGVEQGKRGAARVCRLRLRLPMGIAAAMLGAASAAADTSAGLN
jgi:hypothetical protein